MADVQRSGNKLVGFIFSFSNPRLEEMGGE